VVLLVVLAVVVLAVVVLVVVVLVVVLVVLVVVVLVASTDPRLVSRDLASRLCGDMLDQIFSPGTCRTNSK
jgi:hypothetical protein